MSCAPGSSSASTCTVASRWSAGVTWCTSPVISSATRAVAVPGTGPRVEGPRLGIAPLVAPSGSAVADAAQCDPTQISTQPGSTIRTPERPVNANRVVGTSNRTRRDSPCASSIRA